MEIEWSETAATERATNKRIRTHNMYVYDRQTESCQVFLVFGTQKILLFPAIVSRVYHQHWLAHEKRYMDIWAHTHIERIARWNKKNGSKNWQ